MSQSVSMRFVSARSYCVALGGATRVMQLPYAVANDFAALALHTSVVDNELKLFVDIFD